MPKAKSVTINAELLSALQTLAGWVDGRFNQIEKRLDEGKLSGRAHDELRGFTLKDVADRLQVSEHTVARLISHELIRAVYVGARLTIPASEVVRVIRDGIPDIPAGYRAKGTASGEGRTRAVRKRRK